MCVLFAELAVISYFKYKYVQLFPGGEFGRLECVYWLCMSNGGVLNAYGFGEIRMFRDKDSIDLVNKRTAYIFIRLSSITTFLHHATVLSVIMILLKTCPEYLKQERFNDLILKPDGPHFFWVFGVTLLLGVLSTLLLMYLARTVANPVSEDDFMSKKILIDEEQIMWPKNPRTSYIRSILHKKKR